MQKICKVCGIEKPITEFTTHRTNKDGYNGKCKTCVAEYGRQYREKNIEKEKARTRVYYELHKLERKEYADLHKERIQERNKKYIQNNAAVISKRRKLAREQHKNEISSKQAKYFKERMLNDDLFRLKKQIQGLIRDSLRNKDIKKNKRTLEILGCTVSEFKSYLESKFEPWMNWENKGKYNGTFNYGWDIDHIIPASSAANENELLRLNHYTNLQPLCSRYNRDIKRNLHSK